MLLGTDVPALMTTLDGARRRRARAQLLDRARGHARRDPLPRRELAAAAPLHPQRRASPTRAPTARRSSPQEPEPARRDPRRVRRALRRRHRRRLLRDHARAHRGARRAGQGPRSRGERPSPGPIQVSSMITAAPLVQEPRPTLVGERVNSQGSKKAKELLLADDYDGLIQVAEDQVNGGAHVLDVCVALTERQDEDEQMSEVVERVSLTQPAPIQIDSTEPEVIEAALEHIPGRAIVNSVNLEAGPDKLNKVAPLAKAHGACLIALTIDEEGMAKTGERKVEIAKRINELVCDEHGLEPEALIFDALTFTLTTGDEEWRPSAVETIEGIRQIKAEIPGVKTSPRRLQRLLRHLARRPRRPQLRLPAPLRRGRARPGDGQPEPHHALRRDPRERARAHRRPRLQPLRGRPGEVHRALRVEGRGGRGGRRATRPRAWSPRRPCTGRSCTARRRGSRTGSTSRSRRSARSPPSTPSCSRR